MKTRTQTVQFASGRRLSRRAMVRGSGVALALPWLDAMQPAFAKEQPTPLRLIGILNFYGFHTPFLLPKTPGRAYESTPYLDLLKPHRDDMTVISGLNHPDVRDGHYSDRSFFTGAVHPGATAFRNSVSLDQVAAETIGRQTRYASLNFSTNKNRSCSYTRAGVAIPPETSARSAFAQLFVNGSAEEAAREVAAIEEGQSILDVVGAEAKRLERAVGPTDREKLDQYFTSVRELEQRMELSEQHARRPKPDPGTKAIEDAGPGEGTAQFGLLLDVARLAVQTDLTRLVTLYYVGTSKTPSDPASTFAHHDLSHHGQNEDKIRQLAILERDVLKEWGGFLGKLRQTSEQGGRLIDSTVTVLGSALGNASSHEATNLPILLAGGPFRHGSHLAHDPANPPPLCNLWVQLLNTIGVEVDRFGTSTGSTLPGLETA